MPGWRNGRREGLKPPWAEQARVGSNPTPGTKRAPFDIGSERTWNPGRWVGEGRGTEPGPHDDRSEVPHARVPPWTKPVAAIVAVEDRNHPLNHLAVSTRRDGLVTRCHEFVTWVRAEK